MVVSIDTELASLYVYPEKKIVHHEVRNFIFGDNLKELLNRGADVFEKNNCTKWLSDDRAGSALALADVVWTKHEWEPRILKAGWKHWALVLPEEVLGRMSMEPVISRYSKIGVILKVFTDPARAMSWLEKQ